MDKKGKKRVVINDAEFCATLCGMKIEDKIRCNSDAHGANYNTVVPEICPTLFSNRDEIRGEQQRQVMCRAKPALQELLNSGTEVSHDLFFKKFVILCITMSGLGNPHSSAVIKETQPALNSVLKAGDIARLMELPMENREHNFLELIQIVMGIRLFNKDCLKGGEGIDDLPELLTRAVDSCKNQLTELQLVTQSECERLTSALLPESHCASVAHSEELKINLHSIWKRHIYLKRLALDLSASERHISSCVDQLRQTLVQLHDTVRYRAAIPTVQVYPLFIQLSIIWRELQYETAVISSFKMLAQTAAKINDKRTKTSASSAEKNSNSAEPNPALKFGGFCPWTVVQTGGVLLVGSILVDNIAFQSSECSEAWLKDPVKSADLLHSVLSKFRDLPYILQMSPPASSAIQRKSIVKADAEVQTEVHPIRSFIDSSYVWSYWELKKKAVQLARIAQCETKSQQTRESAFPKNSKITQISNKY